eukprot:scaffold805_cov218-Chaetoceros_neogracile.AAC.6
MGMRRDTSVHSGSRDGSALGSTSTTATTASSSSAGGMVVSASKATPTSNSKREITAPWHGELDNRNEQYDDLWMSGALVAPAQHYDGKHDSTTRTSDLQPSGYIHDGPIADNYVQHHHDQQQEPMVHLARNNGTNIVEDYNVLQQQQQQEQQRIALQQRLQNPPPFSSHNQQPPFSSSFIYPHHDRENQNAASGHNRLSAPPTSQNYQQRSWHGDYSPSCSVGAFENSISNASSSAAPALLHYKQQMTAPSPHYSWPQRQAYGSTTVAATTNQQHHHPNGNNAVGVYPLTIPPVYRQERQTSQSSTLCNNTTNVAPHSMGGYFRQHDPNLYQRNFFAPAQMMGAPSSAMPAVGALHNSGLGQHNLINSQSLYFGTNDSRGLELELPKKKDKKRRYVKVANDEPRRPLSAYNFFFKEEKEIVIALLPELPEGRASDGETSSDADIQICDLDVNDVQGFLIKAKQKLSPEALVTIRGKIEKQTERTLLAHLEGDKPKKSHKKSHGKISFQKLAGVIGVRWRDLSDERRKRYFQLAKTDQERYKLQHQILAGNAGLVNE